MALELAAAAGLQTVAFNQQGAVRADVYLDQFDQILGSVLPSSITMMAS